MGVDKAKLVALITEAKARGLDVNALVDRAYTAKMPRQTAWPIDTDGYFVSNDGKKYNPTPTHAKFIQSQARFSLIYGSRGLGKSSAGAQKTLRLVKQGKSGLVINPRFEDFKTSTWVELRKWIPWEKVSMKHKYKATKDWLPTRPFIVPFSNGAVLYCKGLRDPNSARGPNVNFFWYDEGQKDEEGLGWQIANAGVRVGENTQSFLTGTPNGLDHWMYEFFIEQNIPEEVREEFEKAGGGRPLIEVFYGTIEENKENLDPSFYASMLAAYPSGWLREQEIEGKFVSKAGAMGDLSWLKFVDKTPFDIHQKIRYWDLAATEKKRVNRRMNDPDETVGTLISTNIRLEDFCLEDQVGGTWEWGDIKKHIIRTARNDGVFVPIIIEQEGGSGGKNQIAEVASLPELRNFMVIGHRPEGDKVVRANYWYAMAEQGHIYILKGKWNKPFSKQFSGFPYVKHDDRVDSPSGGIQYLSPVKKWATPEFMAL